MTHVTQVKPNVFSCQTNPLFNATSSLKNRLIARETVVESGRR